MGTLNQPLSQLNQTFQEAIFYWSQKNINLFPTINLICCNPSLKSFQKCVKVLFSFVKLWHSSYSSHFYLLFFLFFSFVSSPSFIFQYSLSCSECLQTVTFLAVVFRPSTRCHFIPIRSACDRHCLRAPSRFKQFSFMYAAVVIKFSLSRLERCGFQNHLVATVMSLEMKRRHGQPFLLRPIY